MIRYPNLSGPIPLRRSVYHACFDAHCNSPLPPADRGLLLQEDWKVSIRTPTMWFPMRETLNDALVWLPV